MIADNKTTLITVDLKDEAVLIEEKTNLAEQTIRNQRQLDIEHSALTQEILTSLFPQKICWSMK
jgi:hypothetical protein